MGTQQKSMAQSSKDSVKETGALPTEFEDLPDNLRQKFLDQNKPTSNDDWKLLIIQWISDF